MKSIKDTLTLVDNLVDRLRRTVAVDIALVGGYAVISHGVARTTMDVDFLIYSAGIRENALSFIDLIRGALPSHFETKWVEGSGMADEPFPYDILFLTDGTGEYPKMDFIVPRYKWELEGLQKARSLKGIPFPVLTIPYLIAMKLRAGGPRDHSDILDLFPFLSPEEKEETLRLAVLVRRDRKLKELLAPPTPGHVEADDADQLI